MIKALMVEDDPDIAELLEEYLAKFNIQLRNIENPKHLMDILKNERYDLLILDLTLPYMDGLEVCKRVRERYDIPIIISSARGDTSDKVVGLELGADDYIAKPYEPRELVARIQAVLRRYKRVQEEGSGEFRVDRDKMLIYKGNQVLELTVAEYEVLALLIENRGRVLSRDYILENTSSMHWDSIDRSVDVIVSRIRKKLGDDPKSPKYIKSVRGVGYKFVG